MIDEIKKRISLKIDINQIEIIDQSHQHAGHSQNKGGGHYKAIIISNDFVNKIRYFAPISSNIMNRCCSNASRYT